MILFLPFQAADTQFGLIANFGDGTIKDQYPNITWEKEIELCTQSVKVLNALRYFGKKINKEWMSWMFFISKLITIQ